MSVTLDVVRNALKSSSAYSQEEVDNLSSTLTKLLEIITRMKYENEPVTPEGICLVHADLIEDMIDDCDDTELRDMLAAGVNELREFPSRRIDLIGDMTDEEILTAAGGPLNEAAIELFRRGELTYNTLLIASPDTLLPKT